MSEYRALDSIRKPMWNLLEGVEVCKRLEPEFKKAGYHIALGGSVLYAGSSDDDLDIIVYKHSGMDQNEGELFDYFRAVYVGFESCSEHDYKSPTKSIFKMFDSLDRRIDLIFIH